MGIQFRHKKAKDVHSPGFYLHLEPGSCFVGLGIWHPDGGTLKAIRETPPDKEELDRALKQLGGDIRKLFNTSGMDYRALGMKEKLPSMSDDEAISLLSKNGNLVKRPFVIGNGVVLTGFKPEAWKDALL